MTTTSSVARSQLVAQWPNTARLCGMVTRRPSTLGVDDRPRITSSRAGPGTCIGTHTALCPRAPKLLGQVYGRLHVLDRVTDDREQPGRTAQVVEHPLHLRAHDWLSFLRFA